MVDVWCMIHDSRFTNNDSWLILVHGPFLVKDS